VEKTTLEYLADALRLTHRAILAGNPTDEQKKLLTHSSLNLLLMESQLAGLGDGAKSGAEQDLSVYQHIGALDGPFFVRGEGNNPQSWNIGFFDREGLFHVKKTETDLAEAFHKARVMNDDRTDYIACHSVLRKTEDRVKQLIAALDRAEIALLGNEEYEAADHCRAAINGAPVPDQWRKTNSDQS